MSGLRSNANSAPVGWAALQASGPFSVVIADPPWDHYGASDKWAAAAKFYSLMTDEELCRLPVPDLLARKAVVFMWCTSSSLARAINLLGAWDLHYRGVAFVWCKTAQSGKPIGAQGVRPSITKPLTEFVIAGSAQSRGRPLPLASEAVRQTVFAPRGRHSEKPEDVQASIEEMYPDLPKAELFARRWRHGWTCWGNEAPVPPHATAALAARGL
jgi:N6-adenosine-specific RNA methylase IME4